MTQGLLISVRLHDGRYHGTGDGPPSPGRLFQALVAGAGLSGPLSPEQQAALEWLERLAQPPVIAAPTLHKGQAYVNYVPDNDLDSQQGDPRRIAAIRTGKQLRPWLFDHNIPFSYGWRFEESDECRKQAEAVCSLAGSLYQFGRGVDFAWATADVIGDDDFDERLENHPGHIFRPQGFEGDVKLACPMPGSLNRLTARYNAGLSRFVTRKDGHSVAQEFRQPPKPRFRQVAYDCPPVRALFELRQGERRNFEAWPLAQVSSLVEAARDAATARLKQALPDQASVIERILVGRKVDGTDDGTTLQRVRIIPLPTIGHPHADSDVRRLLIEVPAACPLRADDVHWAFSGIELHHPRTEETLELTAGTAENMLKHFGIGGDSTSMVWKSITPVALPESARRRRIDPNRQQAEAKAGTERATEQARAASAVVQALRHAGIDERPAVIRVQREPFIGRGERVEPFAKNTRFSAHQLWHVMIEFAETSAIKGPLLIGNGRFLGLGLMAPSKRSRFGG